MRDCRIQTLNTYSDWLDKAQYEYNLYVKSQGAYDLTNCLLTLNAIPEWIFKSANTPTVLKLLAKEKQLLMQSSDFILNTSKLSDIDHQLKFVRMFCNHAKHNKSEKVKNEHNLVSIELCCIFPAEFPVKFDHIKIGDETFTVEPILRSIIAYWDCEIYAHQKD